jgi:long-subunit fatty acid transport protein
VKRLAIVAFCQLLASYVFAGGPYPAVSGISATVDDAAVAGMNPAGMTYLDQKSSRFELLGFFSDSTWEGRLDKERLDFFACLASLIQKRNRVYTIGPLKSMS